MDTLMALRLTSRFRHFRLHFVNHEIILKQDLVICETVISLYCFHALIRVSNWGCKNPLLFFVKILLDK